jgi:hypothetical protein
MHSIDIHPETGLIIVGGVFIAALTIVNAMTLWWLVTR